MDGRALAKRPYELMAENPVEDTDAGQEKAPDARPVERHAPAGRARPRPGRGLRSLVNTRAGLIISVSVAFLAIYGLAAVRAYSEDRYRGQVALAEISAGVSRLNQLESSVLQVAVVDGGGSNPGLKRALDSLPVDTATTRAEIEGDFSEFLAGDPPPDVRRVLESQIARYTDDIDVQVGLLQDGEYFQAYRYDRQRIDRAARALDVSIDRADNVYSDLAQRASIISHLGTATIVIFAALALGILQRERNRWAKEMAHRALHDPLTDLPNRDLLKDRVEHALARAARTGETHAVLFLDLDNFKWVNDTLGHDVGDCVLIEVAARVGTCLRPTDTIARLGGDEFAILLEDVGGTRDASMLSERITRVLDDPLEIRGNRMTVSASVGVALCGAGDKIEDILANADVAMYAAKSGGKGMYELYEPQMRNALLLRLDIEADLRRALHRNEFMLHYQPIIDVQSGAIEGAEALVRWLHPVRGLVPPNDFIPLAEQTGLIKDLGSWVLEAACRQTREWQESHPDAEALKVGVNLSARQLHEPGFMEEIKSVLAATGLTPSTLILEVTESMLMRNTDATIQKLSELKALGVRLAVDDFGTGYSSLSYLTRFPIDIIKIDRAFVEGIERGAEESALVKAIIRMGESLNLQTVAEGIETQEQLTELRRLGCTQGQGFFVARPLDAEVMSMLLEDRERQETLLQSGPETWSSASEAGKQAISGSSGKDAPSSSPTALV
ncbi:MAG: EAL domain-containing protein [Actinobacteria bacterium]|nr:EAL domain-containing protein [Actinomycetota bacterium]